jgi:hypothetical protein
MEAKFTTEPRENTEGAQRKNFSFFARAKKRETSSLCPLCVLSRLCGEFCFHPKRI